MIKNIKDKSKAQTMVEFALVLPILMLIVFGLLEVGRLVFVYVSIASASREAVRYGSATGVNNTTQNINKYRDCAGIRAAAQNVDFLNSFTDNDILIEYYHANSTTRFSTCPVGGLGPAVISNGDRIYVHIQGNFEPVVSFIPLLTRTVANGNPITSQNFHTLIGSADIPITWFRPGDSSGTGEEPCYNCFEPNLKLCNNYAEGEDIRIYPSSTTNFSTFKNDSSTSLPSNWFKDWLGNCYVDPTNNDYCSNLSGKQKSMPAGYYYDESVYPPDRKCVALNSGDVCPNIEGIQDESFFSTSEYVFDESSGYCVIDYCRYKSDITGGSPGAWVWGTTTDFPGIQYALPSAYYFRYEADISQRLCSQKPKCDYPLVVDWTNLSNPSCKAILDFCTNIAGEQSAVPPGYIRDDISGKCYPIPVCRYSSSGEVPLKIVEGSTTNEPTIWYIKNETSNPIKITQVWINWDDTDHSLYLKSLYIGAFKINNINIAVSGYGALANGESILLEGGETLQVGVTYYFDEPAPQEMPVDTVIDVTFGTSQCYFESDPSGILPDQPTCGDLNVLESDCAAQRN